VNRYDKPKEDEIMIIGCGELLRMKNDAILLSKEERMN
jgi:hypothetical protein